jgi:hypothetical protein
MRSISSLHAMSSVYVRRYAVRSGVMPPTLPLSKGGSAMSIALTVGRRSSAASVARRNTGHDDPPRAQRRRRLSEAAWQSQVVGLARLYDWRVYHPPDNRPDRDRAGRAGTAARHPRLSRPRPTPPTGTHLRRAQDRPGTRDRRSKRLANGARGRAHRNARLAPVSLRRGQRAPSTRPDAPRARREPPVSYATGTPDLSTGYAQAETRGMQADPGVMHKAPRPSTTNVYPYNYV